jgi:hypothetical protein
MQSPKSAITNNRYLKLALLLLTVTGVCAAKSQVTRIDVMRGKAALVSIEAPAAAQLTIWSGPGTASHAGEASAGDIADWKRGPVKAPAGGPVYEVAFLCEACEPARQEAWRCYGVRYAPGKHGAPGLIQIPEAGDPEFPGNVQTIYRGVEGQWFHASPKWEEIVRARLREALMAGQSAANAARHDAAHVPPARLARASRAKPSSRR